MAQSLETLVVDLRARTKLLERDLDKANRAIARKMKAQGRAMATDMSAGFSRAFGKLAAITGVAVSFGALQSAIRSTVQESSMLQTTADKLGLTTTALQELRYAGEQFNITSQTTDMALQRFSRRLAEAAQGGGELKGTLEQYGITVRDANGNTRATLDVLRDYADAVGGAESEQERLRMAFKAFDSEGVSFVNILRDGSTGLAELTAQAHAFGGVVESQQVRRLAELDKRIKDLGSAWSTLRAELLTGALDVTDALGLTGALNKLDRLAGRIDQVNQSSAIDPGFVFNSTAMTAALGEDITELKIRYRKELMDLVTSTRAGIQAVSQELQNAEANQSVVGEGTEAGRLYADVIANLRGELHKLTAQEQALMDKHPQAIALRQMLTHADQGRANALALTAAEMSQLSGIMAATVTPAEKLEEQLALLNLAVKAFPQRAAEYEEAARRLKAAYEESLRPDKMDKLLSAWEDMSDRMSTSLSEALVEGGNALDNFLVRSLQKLQAAALESAIINPILGGITSLFGSGKGGASPYIFGFAGGGRPAPGEPYVVGERGPEIRVDDRPGTILPNNIMRSLSGTGSSPGNVTVHQTINFNSDLASVRQQISQSVPLITQATQAAISDRQRRRPF